MDSLCLLKGHLSTYWFLNKVLNKYIKLPSKSWASASQLFCHLMANHTRLEKLYALFISFIFQRTVWLCGYCLFRIVTITFKYIKSVFLSINREKVTPSWKTSHHNGLKPFLLLILNHPCLYSVTYFDSLPLLWWFSLIHFINEGISQNVLFFINYALSTFSLVNRGLKALSFDIFLSNVSCYVSIFVISPSLMNMYFIILRGIYL